ncbi:serine hydrolase domain-containing protein [uncultured Paraglaciecola sp.]|uniref:serine hydrolase domain-containing protein n=1 Tax=uncultured Paraglaciecola sp. TaxID=1765024 RepID=UPI0025D85434|nr:serine hydrolase domain-containing protein [uncultured Paraglaciecola sp.]
MQKHAQKPPSKICSVSRALGFQGSIVIRLKYLSGIVFLFIVMISTSVSSQPNEESVLNEMRLLKQQYKLPSLSLAINIDNKSVFAGAIGYADLDERKKATVDTQYSVGSLAKPMTGIALAKLVDLKKISLDSLVSQYIKLPDYTDSFTVRELASHIAGIPHDTPERDEAEFVNTKDHKSPLDAFYVFSSHPLLFNPGTEYKYSSNGYILLSGIIEQAAAMNYVDFLQSSLWSKFGMESTELDTSFAGVKHEATYYSDYNTDGKYVLSTKTRDRSFLFGGGGFISTPTDLTNMAQATYSDNYLSREAKQEIYTPTKLRNGEVNSDKYSLGWRVGTIKFSDDDKQTWTVLHHGGVTDKASTAYLFVIPECKASIAFATNYIPNKFWRMRPKMAEILKSYINVTECKKS